MSAGGRKIVGFCKLGRRDYGRALSLQENFIARHDSSISSQTWQSSDTTSPALNPNVVLLLEHSPVYTVGIRSNEFTGVDEASLREMGAEFYRTNRGGLITFHGPGQLVAYPILNLRDLKVGVRCYVSKLEEVLIRTCAEFGVTSGRTEHTGIWVDRSKIGAIGINCKRQIVSHGIALNCNTDLRWFDHIVPCGLKGYNVTSITKETGRETTIDSVLPVFVDKFAEVFNVGMTEFLSDSVLSEQNAKIKQNVLYEWCIRSTRSIGQLRERLRFHHLKPSLVESEVI